MPSLTDIRGGRNHAVAVFFVADHNYLYKKINFVKI